jgi:hypothetical protein
LRRSCAVSAIGRSAAPLPPVWRHRRGARGRALDRGALAGPGRAGWHPAEARAAAKVAARRRPSGRRPRFASAGLPERRLRRRRWRRGWRPRRPSASAPARQRQGAGEDGRGRCRIGRRRRGCIRAGLVDALVGRQGRSGARRCRRQTLLVGGAARPTPTARPARRRARLRRGCRRAARGRRTSRRFARRSPPPAPAIARRRQRLLGRARRCALSLGDRDRRVEIGRLDPGIFGRMRHVAFPRTAR